MAYNTGVITEKTYHFALRIVKAYKYLREEQNEYVLSKQMLRSGTSIGANCKEAIYAQSTLDFINKLSIALKEASETEYWLDLLHDSQYIDDKSYESIHNENIEIIKLLTSIIKTTKSTL
jgi:four helix bundle protein